jgi:hypothetical protein
MTPTWYQLGAKAGAVKRRKEYRDAVRTAEVPRKKSVRTRMRTMETAS